MADKKLRKAEPAGDKKKALENALATIRKQYGDGAIMRLGDRPPTMDVDVIPTGILSLDIALGVGGWPRGRIVEIFGSEGSGKTTIALQSLAEAQRQGGTVAFIDAEHALPREYAEALGIDLDELLISQPDTGEQAMEIVDALVRSGAVDVIVVDSVAALVPEAELQGDMGDSHVGLQARLMSQALRKIAGSVANTRSVVIFINQLRERIGVMFGPSETTPGGRALKFWASVRLELRRGEWIRRGQEVIGTRTSIKVVKNKVAPPFKQATVDIIYGKGVVKELCLIDEGVKFGVIEKSGSWYSYGDLKLGQGRENAAEFLRQNPDIAAEVEERIREAAGLKRPEAVEAAGGEGEQG